MGDHGNPDFTRTLPRLRQQYRSSRALTRQAIKRARRAAVNGDATRLQQVVSNLLHNAVRCTPAGGSIAVTRRVADEVVLEVHGGSSAAHSEGRGLGSMFSIRLPLTPRA